jgi:hypothetical protein
MQVIKDRCFIALVFMRYSGAFQEIAPLICHENVTYMSLFAYPYPFYMYPQNTLPAFTAASFCHHPYVIFIIRGYIGADGSRVP